MAPPSSAPPPYTPLDTSQHKIIISIDFGTTFIGIAWASTEGQHIKTIADVALIDDWPGPGRHGDYAVKTPSRIAYAYNNAQSHNAFGFQVTPKMQSYAWMKLLLDPEQATKFDDPSLSQTEGHGVLARPSHKTPVELCADYLAEVAKHAYGALAKRITEEILANTQLEFWFSVPAVWSDRAKSNTLRAAQLAAKIADLKFEQAADIFLIREPEAAAIATLSALSVGGSEQQVKPGDSVLVCDCGGGTVDVTSYQIVALSPKLKFQELVPGTGGKCGASYVDREFIKWMERTFGDSYKRLGWEKRGPSSRLMKEFENVKRDFGKAGAPDPHEIMCPMKDVSEDHVYYDDDEGIVNLPLYVLRALFKPVVDKIIALLQSQLDAEIKQNGKTTIKTMMLVGGFGDSVYINNIVREWCDKSGIRLICPEQPQAAIVRGAALAGLTNIQPTHRRSRRHYGYDVHRPFDPSKHSPEDYFLWDWDGSARAGGCILWPLAKGAIIDEHSEISVKLSMCLTEEHARYWNSEVFVADSDEPPETKRDPRVRKLVDFKTDLGNTDLKRFPSRKRNGVKVYMLMIEYRITFGARRGILGFCCLINGKELGKTTVTFDGQEPVNAGTASDTSTLCAMQ